MGTWYWKEGARKWKGSLKLKPKDEHREGGIKKKLAENCNLKMITGERGIKKS